MYPPDEQELRSKFARIERDHNREVWMGKFILDRLRSASQDRNVKPILQHMKPDDLLEYAVTAGQVLAALRILDERGEHVTVEDVLQAFEDSVPPLSTGKSA